MVWHRCCVLIFIFSHILSLLKEQKYVLGTIEYICIEQTTYLLFAWAYIHWLENKRLPVLHGEILFMKIFYKKNKTTHEIQTTGMFKQNTINHIRTYFGKTIWEFFLRKLWILRSQWPYHNNVVMEMIKYDQSWLFWQVRVLRGHVGLVTIGCTAIMHYVWKMDIFPLHRKNNQSWPFPGYMFLSWYIQYDLAINKKIFPSVLT